MYDNSLRNDEMVGKQRSMYGNSLRNDELVRGRNSLCMVIPLVNDDMVEGE